MEWTIEAKKNSRELKLRRKLEDRKTDRRINSRTQAAHVCIYSIIPQGEGFKLSFASLWTSFSNSGSGLEEMDSRATVGGMPNLNWYIN